MAKNSKNFLDFIPIISDKNSYTVEEDIVTIHMKHTGFYNRLAQKVFKTPEISHIKLDEYGSFIWNSIDGVRSVGEIADAFKLEYGEKAEPLYERLVKYMQILYNNKFIVYKRGN